MRHALALWLFVSPAALAADAVPLPFTLLDAPEAFAAGPHAPTWEQALDLNGGLLQAVHLGVHFAFDRLDGGQRRWWTVLLEELAVVGFDLFNALVELPFTDGWMHEEGHRAAMATAGMTSLQAFDNLFYAPAQRCDSGSVCGMTDASIAAVKLRRNADWVRVQAAGMETELAQVHRLERNAFFHDLAPATFVSTYWLTLASVEVYRHICTDESQFNAAAVAAESPHQLQRDFTGPDCTGWAYDLFRPDEPYAARGLHPNGDGVLRVRLWSALGPDEREYLTRMRNLGVLNFVDPQLFGFVRFTVTLPSGAPLAFNASLQHDLTAFGDALGLQLLASSGALRGFAHLRLFRNQLHAFPGLEAGLVRYPFTAGPVQLFGSLTAELWLQPAGFSFTTADVLPGGALELNVAAQLAGPLEVFLAVRAKSAGWRPADPWLDASASVRLGLNLLLPAHGASHAALRQSP